MNLKRVRSLMVCVLPLCLPLLAACNAPAGDAAPAEAKLGRSAQALGGTVASPISAGGVSSLALASDGTVSAWGDNTHGELGNGTTTSSTLPVQVGGLSGITAVSAGNDSVALALKSDGTVWAWGSNTWGQLGIGNPTSSYDQTTPAQITGLSGLTITQAVAAANDGLALASDGTVWTWGFNGEGQLGYGSIGGNTDSPAQVTALSGITALAAGDAFALALASDGTVWARGNDTHGQLGDGTTTNRGTPEAIGALSGIEITAVVAGPSGSSSFALASDGTVWAWGGNGNGQLGNDTTTDQYLPVQVLTAVGVPLSGVTAVAAGNDFALALRSDGTVWSWGSNGTGQIGDGTSAPSRHMAVEVHGQNDVGYLTGVQAIAAGQDFALAQKADGSIWAWGYNDDGQLGDGTTHERRTPVPTAATFAVGSAPQGLAFDGTNMWVANRSGGSVTEIAASTGAVVGTYAVGGFPYGLAFDGADMWVSAAGDNGVQEIQASTGALLGFEATDAGPQGIAFDGTNMWVANWNGGSVSQVVVATGTVTNFGGYESASGVAFDGAHVWITIQAYSRVTELEASTGAVVGTYSVGTGPLGIVFDGTNLWTADSGANTVTKVSASTGATLGTYAVGTSPSGVAFDGVHIWVTNNGSNTVTELTASTGALVDTFTVGTQPSGIAFDGARMWVANSGDGTVTRL